MAEGLLRGWLPDITVFSAGLAAPNGAPADAHAVALMAERGIDISTHRSQRLARWMIEEADWIFTMDSAQQHLALARYPQAARKIRRLGEAADIDIPDPWRRGRLAFLEALLLIERAAHSRLPQLRAHPAPACTTACAR